MSKEFEGDAEYKELTTIVAEVEASLAEVKEGWAAWQRVLEATATATRLAEEQAEQEQRARMQRVEAEQRATEERVAPTGAARDEDGEEEKDSGSDNDDNDDDDDDETAAEPVTIRVPPRVVIESPRKTAGRRALGMTLDAQVSAQRLWWRLTVTNPPPRGALFTGSRHARGAGRREGPAPGTAGPPATGARTCTRRATTRAPAASQRRCRHGRWGASGGRR
jgi:hypothetical protein